MIEINNTTLSTSNQIAKTKLYDKMIALDLRLNLIFLIDANNDVLRL
jgi:hypothetical protein